MKIKIARARRNVEQKGLPYNIRKLKDQATNGEFILHLKNRFQVLSATEDGTLTKKWERVKTSFTTTCEEKLGYTRKEYKMWLSEDTIEAIEKRRSTEEQLEQAKTRAQKQRLGQT
jgi:hypothetical protein